MNGIRISKSDRDALENLWDKAGAWAADTWADLNRHCFDGQLRYQGIVFGLTPHAGRLGHTSPSGRITLHSALLDPRDEETVWSLPVAMMGTGYAADVLVHEMVHAWLFQQGIQSDESHNCQPWCEQITRISPRLGLGQIRVEPVRPRRVANPARETDPTAAKTIVVRKERDGFLSQRQLAYWPHSCRDPRWYGDRNERIYVPL